MALKLVACVQIGADVLVVWHTSQLGNWRYAFMFLLVRAASVAQRTHMTPKSA